ncbi:MAG: ABC transporter substrate-binding protein [Planctomycetota bacterium]|nr:MAG: ABC transporter substrate-binding protein [Planctomycetota bacterium]
MAARAPGGLGTQPRRARSARGRAALWLAALAALASGAAGCGPGAEPPGVVTVRLVVWRPDIPEAWERALALFHARHPGIRVVRELGPSSSSELHALLTQKLRNRDRSVDAFIMDVVWAAELALAGWALPLDERLPPAERERFFPAAIEAVTVEGRLYGVPFNTDAGLLYYRKDLLAAAGLEPPETWPELVAHAEAARAAARAAGLPGAAGIYGYSGQFRQYEGLVCNMLEFIRSHGGRLTAPDEPPALAAVAFVRDRIIGGAAPRGALTWAEQESLEVFKSGGAVFLRSWPYAWAVLQDPAQSAVAGRVGIAPLPRFEGGPSTSCLGGWSFGIHRASRHPEQAWAVVRFLTSPEVQRLFAVLAGKAPARRALYADPEVLAANPHFAALRPVFERAVPRPRSPIYPQISYILQRYLHAALSDPASDLPALAQQARRRLERARARLGR